MSLFIVGSVSRVTSNIIHQIAKNSQYSAVTIADLLPSYEYHQRFYRLQRQLDQQQSKLKLKLNRLHNLNDILQHKQYDDVLYVTHDYYENVVSKTRLMELTALACKLRNYLYFATPVQYDHFGYANPEAQYFQSQDKVFQINPNSTVIRSDVQNMAEATYGLRSSSGSNFKPKYVDSQLFAKTVCQTMASKVQGKRILVRGTSTTDAGSYNNKIEDIQCKHSRDNLSQLASKYGNLSFSGYNGETRIAYKAPKTQNKQKVQKTQKAKGGH